MFIRLIRLDLYMNILGIVVEIIHNDIVVRNKRTSDSRIDNVRAHLELNLSKNKTNAYKDLTLQRTCVIVEHDNRVCMIKKK
jgi:hypothetical protein